MPGVGFKFRGFFNLAQTGNCLGTAGVKSAAGGRVYQAGRFARRHFFHHFSVFSVRIRGRREQGQGVGVQRRAQHLSDACFFDDLSGIHDEDPF